MKKVIFVAALTTAALAAAPLFADQTQHGRGQDRTAAADGCPMMSTEGRQAEHRAEMQKRMQEMHGRMGPQERRGRGEHEHQQ